MKLYSRFATLTNTQKIALITFFSSLYFYSHVGTLYLQMRGLNLFEVNSLNAILMGSLFLAEAPTGVIADKLGRKRSVIVAMALQVLGEVLYLFSRSYWAFALISVIAGVGFAFASGCVEALIYDTLPKEQRDLAMKKAMGLKGLAYQLAFLLAPILGSFLVPVFTLNRFLLAVFLTACSVAVALLVAFTLEEPTNAAGRQAQPIGQILVEGVQQVRQSRHLQWLLLISMLTSTFTMTLVGLYQPYFSQAGLSAFWMGIAFAGGAALAALGVSNSHRIERRLGPRLGLLVTTLLPGIGYLLLAVVHAAPVVFLAFVFTYGTATLKDPLLSAYFNARIAPAQRATVLSFISLFVNSYVATLILLIGWLADRDLRYPFALIGGVILVATVLLRVDKVGVVAKDLPLDP